MHWMQRKKNSNWKKHVAEQLLRAAAALGLNPMPMGAYHQGMPYPGAYGGVPGYGQPAPLPANPFGNAGAALPPHMGMPPPAMPTMPFAGVPFPPLAPAEYAA